MASDPDPDELAALRREYGDAGLDDPDLAPDPVAMFRRWMHDAVVAGLHEPNAMVVATVSPEGRPSARMVLLKGLDERGFVFYTNYDSRKGRELEATPRSRCCSRGTTCSARSGSRGRRRRVPEGRAGPTSPPGRAPRSSAPGPRPSPSEVASRAELEAAYAEAEERFAGQDVPLPPQWGGFRVRPELVEFWQGRRGRMHDRLVYRRDGGGGPRRGWRRRPRCGPGHGRSPTDL